MSNTGSTSSKQPSTESIQSKFQQSLSLRSSFKNKDVSPSFHRFVSFNDELKFIEPQITDDDSIFSLNLKQFKKNVSETSKQYQPDSAEFQCLIALYDVVKKNYEMFNPMFHYLAGLNSSDSVLCQSDGEPPFPEKEIIDKLQKKKVFFENRLNDILIALKPSYDYIIQLVAALDSFDGHIKIEPQQLNDINSMAMMVNRNYKHFNDVFKNFSMKTYKKHVCEIRRIIVIESEKVDGIRTATKQLNKELAELDNIYPNITEALNLSRDINFKSLEKAMTRFSELVKKALGLTTVSSAEDKMRALKGKKALSTFVAEEEMAVKRTPKASSVDQAMNSLRAHEAMLLSESSNLSSASNSVGGKKKEVEKKEKLKSFFKSKLLKNLSK